MARRLFGYIWSAPTTCLGLLIVLAVVISRGRVSVFDGVIEAHGRLARHLLQRVLPARGGGRAMTLGHVVLARDRESLDQTRAHERVHVRQCELWGPLFLPAYLLAGLWARVRGGELYHDNWFERQARGHRAGVQPPECLQR